MSSTTCQFFIEAFKIRIAFLFHSIRPLWLDILGFDGNQTRGTLPPWPPNGGRDTPEELIVATPGPESVQYCTLQKVRSAGHVANVRSLEADWPTFLRHRSILIRLIGLRRAG
jgi:hypothetical protein